MSTSPNESLLARLARLTNDGGSDFINEVAAEVPSHEPKSDKAEVADHKLASLIQRINRMSSQGGLDEPAEPAALVSAAVVPREPISPQKGSEFTPAEPRSLAEAGLTESDVEALAMKFLLSKGDAAGREVAAQVKLPFVLVEQLLRRLKYEQVLVYRGSAPMNDYLYQLTDVGRERARRLSEQCTYFGAAPVTLKDYIASINAQALDKQQPTKRDLERAFHDLLVSPKMLDRLGPAVNSGKGLFLFGAAGNGKTSIAERVTRAFGQEIWIPRALGVDGEIIRIFDPVNHTECAYEQAEGLLDHSKIDKRWVRIVRPTIVVGGELTMANLEVSFNPATGISEAPIQLKSNCGVLVIDDFGRQRISTLDLLNRWIVPLEKRYDFLNLSSGKKVQVPFQQLLIFSTNLEPRDLCDEAFLRRIPYKIEALDPSEEEFFKLFELMSPKLGFNYDPDPVEYLVAKHYRAKNRPFRCCQPRDLLTQVRNYCLYQGMELILTREYFDYAVENYFAVM